MANVGIDSYIHQLALDSIAKGVYTQVDHYNALLNIVDPTKLSLVGYTDYRLFVNDLLTIVEFVRGDIVNNPLVTNNMQLVRLNNEPTLLRDPNLIYIDVVIK